MDQLPLTSDALGMGPEAAGEAYCVMCVQACLMECSCSLESARKGSSDPCIAANFFCMWISDPDTASFNNMQCSNLMGT